MSATEIGYQVTLLGHALYIVTLLSSCAILDWKCPNRARGANIPLDVSHEIFAWLRPAADPDTDRDFYNTTGAQFYGDDYRKSGMPAEAWCRGVKTQLQPVETPRTHVRECELRAWVGRRKVTTQIIPMLSRLDNLAVLTLDGVLPHDSCGAAIYRETQNIEQLTIFHIVGDEGRIAYPCRCTITAHHVKERRWLHRLLPLINPQLVSLCGDFTFVSPEAFLRFIKGHATLIKKTYSKILESLQSPVPYYIDLDPADLPDLRSFGGPFALASKVIGNRPVSKLASPGYVLWDSTTSEGPPGTWYRMILNSGEA
ncbi:hypothetical protein JB92DRAFT_2838765 [Gautieria morchelliformis]|nr:hypothetical protein JB92DRAFT_2838765 [Gautieria morchelliformis]